MTRPDLDALAALLDKATPGSLKAYWKGAGGWTIAWGSVFAFDIRACGCKKEDTALIVAAVNALPDLLAYVRELERERDQAISIRNVFADGLVRSVVDKTANLQGQPVDKTAELQARAAALAMRERCAQACEKLAYAEHQTGKVDHNEQAWTRVCAAAVRALEP